VSPATGRSELPIGFLSPSAGGNTVAVIAGLVATSIESPAVTRSVN